jgi:hypothetical protein
MTWHEAKAARLSRAASLTKATRTVRVVLSKRTARLLKARPSKA